MVLPAWLDIGDIGHIGGTTIPRPASYSCKLQLNLAAMFRGMGRKGGKRENNVEWRKGGRKEENKEGKIEGRKDRRMEFVKKGMIGKKEGDEENNTFMKRAPK